MSKKKASSLDHFAKLAETIRESCRDFDAYEAERRIIAILTEVYTQANLEGQMKGRTSCVSQS